MNTERELRDHGGLGTCPYRVVYSKAFKINVSLLSIMQIFCSVDIFQTYQRCCHFQNYCHKHTNICKHLQFHSFKLVQLLVNLSYLYINAMTYYILLIFLYWNNIKLQQVKCVKTFYQNGYAHTFYISSSHIEKYTFCWNS